MPKTFIPNSEAQRDFVFSNARHAAFVGGTGSGKTASGAVKSVMKINEGEDGIVVGPDFPQFAKSTWPEFAKWLPWEWCTNKHLDHPNTQKKVLEFAVRGRQVSVYYGGIEDPRAWAGPNVNWCWFDEAGRKRLRLAFDVLAARIRVGRSPRMWITTTPAGVHHWLYDVFVKGIFDERIVKELREMGYRGPITEYFHGKTHDNKDNLDPFHYTMLTGLYSGKVAQQELEGAFISMEDAVWEQFGDQNVTTEADYIPGVPVEWGADDGFTRGHPRIILIAQVIPPYVNVVDEYVAEYELPEESIKRALAKPYPLPSVAYVDSAAAEFRSRLWRNDIDTVSATHPVEDGIKHTAAWICDGEGKAHLRFHPRCTFSVKEIANYCINPRTKRPEKASDNAADALRYLMYRKDLYDIKVEGAGYKPYTHTGEVPGDPAAFEGSSALPPVDAAAAYWASLDHTGQVPRQRDGTPVDPYRWYLEKLAQQSVRN